MTLNPWDFRYNINEFYYGTEPNDFLRAQASLLKPASKILCLAEGEGRNAVFLAGLGHEITAVDGSAVGLSKMQKYAESKGVAIHSVTADLEDYALGHAQWDGIISIWCHLPKSLRAKIHSEVKAGLRAGGLFILEAYHPRQLEFKTGGPPDAALMASLEVLLDELSGLELIVAQEVERVIHEGKGHFGKSAVVQIVGRKI